MNLLISFLVLTSILGSCVGTFDSAKRGPQRGKPQRKCDVKGDKCILIFPGDDGYIDPQSGVGGGKRPSVIIIGHGPQGMGRNPFGGMMGQPMYPGLGMGSPFPSPFPPFPGQQNPWGHQNWGQQQFPGNQNQWQFPGQENQQQAQFPGFSNGQMGWNANPWNQQQQGPNPWNPNQGSNPWSQQQQGPNPWNQNQHQGQNPWPANPIPSPYPGGNPSTSPQPTGPTPNPNGNQGGQNQIPNPANPLPSNGGNSNNGNSNLPIPESEIINFSIPSTGGVP
jgi:hypothetical protein